MAEVVPLRPDWHQPLADPYRELQRHRTALIGAWTAWLATNPLPEDVDQEISGTAGAMRGLADLLAVPPGSNILP